MADVLTFQPTLFDDAGAAILGRAERDAEVGFDDSETEDIILVREPIHRISDRRRPADQSVTDTRSADLSTSREIAGVRPSRAPRRIGNGKLVASRVQWRPGDPFGQSTRAPVQNFKWNRMVRSACVTAACGFLLVWLLHIT